MELFSWRKQRLVLAQVVSCCVYEIPKTIETVCDEQQTNLLDNWPDMSLQPPLLESSIVHLIRFALGLNFTLVQHQPTLSFFRILSIQYSTQGILLTLPLLTKTRPNQMCFWIWPTTNHLFVYFRWLQTILQKKTQTSAGFKHESSE